MLFVEISPRNAVCMMGELKKVQPARDQMLSIVHLCHHGREYGTLVLAKKAIQAWLRYLPYILRCRTPSCILNVISCSKSKVCADNM
jgi:hypothetical protein